MSFDLVFDKHQSRWIKKSKEQPPSVASPQPYNTQIPSSDNPSTAFGYQYGQQQQNALPYEGNSMPFNQTYDPFTNFTEDFSWPGEAAAGSSGSFGFPDALAPPRTNNAAFDQFESG